MRINAQSTLEYLLLIGSALIVSGVVIGLIIGVMSSGKDIVHQAADKIFDNPFDNSCYLIDCDNYCEGNTRYFNGSCSKGSCTYASSTVCTFGCNGGSCTGLDLCDGVNCDPYCLGEVRYYNGSCSGGTCSYATKKSCS